MAKVRFRPSIRGINQLMKSPEMQAIMDEKGQAIASRASAQADGAEYMVTTKPLRWIAVTNVSCDNSKAMKDNLENNTLLKELY